MSCVFCAIVAGTAPASVVYDDERVMAFMDLMPVNPGHLLVVPRRHAIGLSDLDPEDGARMFTVGQRLAAGLRSSGLRVEGVNLFLADGRAAFQTVFHAHLHVLPRFVGDRFRLVGFEHREAARPELDATAAAVRATLS
ncbi:HIT family protein [soil metagenome]